MLHIVGPPLTGTSRFRPVHSWVFVLTNHAEEGGDYRLEVQCQESHANGGLEIVGRKWERMDLGYNDNNLMEINFVNLEG